MNKKEKLALFLGMFCGDGCLSLSCNGRGQKDYPVQFTNNSREIITLFDDLFLELFGFRGRVKSRKRPGRKKIFDFRKYSKEVVEKLKKLGFKEGKKKYSLRIPEIIKKGSKSEKVLFINGLCLTDGHISKAGGLAFHLGTLDFIEDLRLLIGTLIKYEGKIKHYIQRDKYTSYQLYLNKQERDSLLMPMLGNGSPAVLKV